ncbi:unnamed protein product, partial [Strongylus vulgaris]
MPHDLPKSTTILSDMKDHLTQTVQNTGNSVDEPHFGDLQRDFKRSVELSSKQC